MIIKQRTLMNCRSFQRLIVEGSAWCNCCFINDHMYAIALVVVTVPLISCLALHLQTIKESSSQYKWGKMHAEHSLPAMECLLVSLRGSCLRRARRRVLSGGAPANRQVPRPSHSGIAPQGCSWQNRHPTTGRSEEDMLE